MHRNPNLPYHCRLIPKPGSMADVGVTRVADLKDDKARNAAIADVVEFASHFAPSEQPEVLARLSAKLDVRPGLLAQELLLYFRRRCTECADVTASRAHCSNSSCLSNKSSGTR